MRLRGCARARRHDENRSPDSKIAVAEAAIGIANFENNL